MTPGTNCKIGSAWHTWQSAGADWRKDHPNPQIERIQIAAECFANLPGWPNAGKTARYKAFMEGAR